MVQVVGNASEFRNRCGFGGKHSKVGLRVEGCQQLPEGLSELPFLHRQTRIDRVRHLIDAGADPPQFRERVRDGNWRCLPLHLRLRLRHRSVYSGVYRRVYAVARYRSMTTLAIDVVAVNRCSSYRLLGHCRRDLHLPCWLHIGRTNRRRNWWRRHAGGGHTEAGASTALRKRRLVGNRRGVDGDGRSGWGRGSLSGQ